MLKLQLEEYKKTAASGRGRQNIKRDHKRLPDGGGYSGYAGAFFKLMNCKEVQPRSWGVM